MIYLKKLTKTTHYIRNLTSHFVISLVSEGQSPKITNRRIFEESGTRRTTTGPANKSACCTAAIFPRPVAKDYSRPPGLKYRPRLPTKFSYSTVAEIYPTNNANGELERNERRNNKIKEERGNYPPKIYTDRFLQSPVSRLQKGSLISSSDRSKSIKPVHTERTLSNGKLTVRKATYKSKGLYGKAGPQRCVSNSRYSSRLSEIPPVHLAGSNLSVPSPAIWSKHRATGFHKIVKASGGVSSHSEHQTSDIPRRHSPCSVKSVDSTRTHEFPNQLREVNTDTIPCNRIPGFYSQFDNHEVVFTSGENNENISPMQVLTKGQSNLVTSSVSTSGLSRVLSTGSMASSTPFPTPTKLPYPASSVEQWVLSRHSPLG